MRSSVCWPTPDAGARPAMMRWLSWLAGGALLLYPLAVYWGLTHAGQTPLLLGLLVIFSLRLLPGLLKGRVRLGPLPEWLWLGRLLACIGLGLTLLSALFSARHGLLYYPLAVSLALLCLFGWSLTRPMSLVERLARLQDPALPPAAIGYTRRVTQVWCGFFVINGALAAFTIWHGDLALWSLYNGLISYALMGGLMGAEYLVRRRLLKRLAP
ncbi:DNA gyrase subunit B [Aeromonas hydrophila]|nr:DNA gyrase subunit B [Aeromonas hydrophila]MBQ4716132.1 DNA gyrase subunit B [Aeromonas hydrophila]MBW3824548.1 DNA gyrase subunit B [Aeromonas hydrophila]MBW5267221.1 DNA gyrase subunit B [Aeromonas hydrophila]QSR50607.1 DNA gyrase subunit B [Aeromonas hydrophila]